MKENKYKILVLSDLNKSASTTLKSTVSLAKMINGDIDVLCVKKPTDIIKNDNQLSAVREINSSYTAVEKQIHKLISPISDQYNMNIGHKLVFGNVKSEIGNYIQETQPDIIVLGKKHSKSLHLIGDNITGFVLKNHDGVIMIAANENALEPNKELALGTLNALKHDVNVNFVNDLLGHTQKPLKSFKIVKKSDEPKAVENNENTNKTVEFVFEHGDNAMKNLSKYLLKNNINLLCVDRNLASDKKGKTSIASEIKEAISTLNVSLLLTGDRTYSVQ